MNAVIRIWHVDNLPKVTHSLSFIVTVIGSVILCLVVITLCAFCMRKRLWRCAKSYATKQSTSSVEEAEAVQGAEAVAEAEAAAAAEAEAEAVAVAVAAAGARERLAQTTLQAAPSAPPVIAVVARRLPSAQATPISSEEAVMYETAAAEVTSSAV